MDYARLKSFIVYVGKISVYPKVILAALLILLAACLPTNEPSAQIALGDLLLEENFDDAPGWDAAAQDNVSIGVRSSAYRMNVDVNSYVRGFNSTPYEDVVIDVETTQYSREENNAYGVICRGSTSEMSSNGYYFLIGADGSYSLRKGQFLEVRPLIKWDKTDAVNEGARVNSIRVICVENYLALYINGEFVADIRDDTFSRGYIGFVATTEDGTLIDVAFDNLRVYAGHLAG